ncbi:MAG: ribose-5-phosphate isomerase RpiA [Syntrophaceae bacterium]
MNTNQLKELAASFAVDFVTSGMSVGLGSGSTALFALKRIARLLAAGELEDIRCVPSSAIIEQAALKLAIPLVSLEEYPALDITIDGADEVDHELNLIKGGGGALLREKILAQASRREMIVVHEAKLSPVLGSRKPVPVEVLPFGWKTQSDFLESLGAEVKLRSERPGVFRTDQGNYILDCRFGPLTDRDGLVRELESRAGIIEHGIWTGLATDVIVAGRRGVRHLRRNEGGRPASDSGPGLSPGLSSPEGA